MEVKELCRRQRRSVYLLSGHRLLDNYEPPQTNRSLRSVALTCWEGHAYLYTSARAVCAKHLATADSMTPVRLANEVHHEMPPVAEWKAWAGTPAPGYFHTSSLSIARMQLLVSGRSPKVILRNAAACDMIALRYTCIKSVDGATGVCVIRELPTERQAIVEFLTRLPIQIIWCGELLPGLMQKVF